MKNQKKIKTFFKVILGLLAAAVLFVIGFLIFSMVTEFKPEDDTALEIVSTQNEIDKKEGLSIVTLNIGYCGLDETQDFFMDGGKNVNPSSEDKVRENITAVDELVGLLESDFIFIQEIDKNSSRSFHIDETELIRKEYGTRSYAQNYVCKWVPYPLPMIGKVDSGIMTMSKYKTTGANRISLPNNNNWFKSMYMLKRCLLVNRFPIKDSDKELVLINLHFEAYSENETKEQQMKILMQYAVKEYEKGNYVVIGGDFNMSFPEADKVLKYIEDEKIWRPGELTSDMIPEKWEMCTDLKTASCRSLDKAYNEDEEHQFYIIDGYIISPNVNCDYVLTVNGNFKHTDHNPVFMKFSFK